MGKSSGSEILIFEKKIHGLKKLPTPFCTGGRAGQEGRKSMKFHKTRSGGRNFAAIHSKPIFRDYLCPGGHFEVRTIRFGLVVWVLGPFEVSHISGSSEHGPLKGQWGEVQNSG